MDIKLAILAAIALAAALHLQFHRPYVSRDWLTRTSAVEVRCLVADATAGAVCQPRAERSRWTRLELIGDRL